jgi:transposase
MYKLCIIVLRNNAEMVVLTPQKRGEIINYALSHPYSTQSAIANSMHIPRTTVSTILRRFRSRGLTTDAPRTGRPETVNSTQMQWLDDYIHTHRNYTSDRIANDINLHFNISVSARTIRRLRKVLGYHSRKRGTYEPPTAQHKQLRLQWCTQHLNTNWRLHVFVDESSIVLRDTGDIEWVKRGDPRRPRIVQNMRASVQVIMAIWWNGHSIVAHNQQINSQVFLQFLEESVYNPHPVTENYTLIMDRASYHTADNVQQWLNDREIDYDYLPPRSPDLDPVDYLWSSFKHIVKMREPSSPDSLWDAILFAQDNMQQRPINNTLDSMQHFVETVVGMKGEIHAH